MRISEDQLEQLSLDWFRETGWKHANGVDISPDGDDPERDDYRVVVLKDRLAEAVARLNSDWLQLGAHCRYVGWKGCGMMIGIRRDAEFTGETRRRKSLRSPRFRVSEPAWATEVPINA
jgi:type I restriction enzyme R subunit